MKSEGRWRYERHVTGTKPVLATDELGCSKYYDSVGQAARELRIPSSSISKCCQGAYKTTYGFKFEYWDSDEPPKETSEWLTGDVKKYRRKSKKAWREPIIAVNIATNRYRMYTSFSEMCSDLELDERNAYRVLAHDRYYKTIGGYALYHENEVILGNFDGTF